MPSNDTSLHQPGQAGPPARAGAGGDPVGLPVAPSAGALEPLGLYDVEITGGFWGSMQSLNLEHIIPHCEHWVEKSGWAGNFDAAVDGRLPQDRTGMVFADSDVYKLVEAMAWEVGRSGDAAMEARLNALVERVARAQEPDGYLNTAFGRPGQPPRYSDLEWGHELYCYGHLIQAAIARGRTHGEDLLVAIARKAADHVCEVFGEDGIRRVGGHPEIELALAEFARYTGEGKYLEQARLFIERRGRGTLGPILFGAQYFQDDVPVREARAMSGHAVRALYLAAGGIDVAVETGDEGLLDALAGQTAATTARRTYITGGMGAHHEGESFGADFELPPDRAYSETCAGVGSVMVHHRLLLARGDEHCADLIERTLYNVVCASPAADGESFFYTNTLHQREEGTPPAPDQASPRAASSLRAPWFEVSCCPTNVARTLASLAAYMATRTEDGIQLHQYAHSRIRTELDDGRTVDLRVATGYPHDGAVRIEVLGETGGEWELGLRIPAWAGHRARLTLNGAPQQVRPGLTTLRGAFVPGDTVELDLPLEPRFVRADPRVDAVRGTVAVERGPLVLCAESTDLPGHADPEGLRILADQAPHTEGDTTVVTGYLTRAKEQSWPFGPEPEEEPLTGPQAIPLIPYHQWANRGPSTMRIWMPLAAANTTDA